MADMTDRELLEAAANAAGIDFHVEWNSLGPTGRYRIGAGGDEWNPLTDDGDALRLAVKLGQIGHFCVNLGSGAVSTEDPAGKPLPVLFACEDMTGDPFAATRRAIVRAAAEIGKEKNNG